MGKRVDSVKKNNLEGHFTLCSLGHAITKAMRLNSRKTDRQTSNEAYLMDEGFSTNLIDSRL